MNYTTKLFSFISEKSKRKLFKIRFKLVMKIEYNCFLTCFKSMKKSKKVDDLLCHVDKFRILFNYLKYMNLKKVSSFLRTKF